MSKFKDFQSSMEMNYEKWHDGVGYDLDALQAAPPPDRAAIEALLLSNGVRDWRDVEALAALDTPRTRQKLKDEFASASSELAMAILRHAPESATEPQRTAAIVRALGETDFVGGLSGALDQAAMFHPPAVEAALWRGVRDRDGGVAVHFAAMLCFLHGKAKEPFDDELRPWFIRFNTPDRAVRAALVAELERKLR